MSKGSGRRPMDEKKYGENYDRIFPKRQGKKTRSEYVKESSKREKIDKQDLEDAEIALARDEKIKKELEKDVE